MSTPATTPRSTTTSAGGNRWLILVGGVLVQLAIGAVYAWSTFAKALQADGSAFDISKVQAAIPFEVAIGMIFVGTFLGGRIQDKRGPRTVALVGVAIYSVGIMLASLARDGSDLWLLVLGYGVLGGFGLGLAYIVPIAMLQKWFPDKTGLITGIAVGGFGFGAVITSPLAQRMIAGSEDYQRYPTKVFLWLGLAYLVAGVIGASVFRNPPEGYTVAGATQSTAAKGDTTAPAARDFTQAEALSTPQWYLLTLILTISVTAGISLISIAAGTATDVAGFSAGAAATLVGVMGLFNGVGRIAWAAVSDKIGKMTAFVGILAIQGLALIAIPHAGNVAIFYVLAALIYLCYGGAFGTMPSTAGSFFGVKNAGGIYGLMLIGWSIGGVVGPLLISALVGEDKAYTVGYTVVGIIALVGAAIPLITKKPAGRTADA
ncbi:MFS transporter [Janibacter melonis]|uniref:MFS transporter n=1 Tax=Janibacter melonis TaxID=262209 RepID=A0A5P8FNN1_9MICO|nr:OFA family MFS transporter [Janibacter melonis]MCB5991462.1 OFA family MFS transporter [Janibacter melonis]MCM3553608.1 OFA family MFS transporter [Janibacter melonis]QFQ31239.2 MFS transporter [Janibacter melonis]